MGECFFNNKLKILILIIIIIADILKLILMLAHIVPFVTMVTVSSWLYRLERVTW